MREDDGLSARKVSCYHGHGDRQVFKAPGLEYPLDQITQPVIAREAQPGNPPSSDITEADSAACGHDARKRRATGIRGTEYAANACAGDIGDRDVILLEDLQDAKVGETARKAAPQSQADACPFGRGRCPLDQWELMGARHEKRMPFASILPNGPGVLKIRYGRTCVPGCQKLYDRSQTVPTY